MKKLIAVLKPFILLLTITLSSCSEDEANGLSSEFYIKFNANGNSFSFEGNSADNNVLGTFNVLEADETDQYASGITAVSDGNNISILIGTIEEAMVNTVYTNYITETPMVKADTYVSALSTDSGLTAFGSLNQELLLLLDGVIADSEIVFTEVTDTYLKGTFSGTWYNFEENNVGISISNGEFMVKRLGN